MQQQQYKQVEIWCANIITPSHKFINEPLKRIPLSLHLRDKRFINRFSKEDVLHRLNIKIEYIKQIGDVNDSQLERIY